MIGQLLDGFTHCLYKLIKIAPAHISGRKWIDAVASPPYYEVGMMLQLMLTYDNCIKRYPDKSIAKPKNGKLLGGLLIFLC